MATAYELQTAVHLQDSLGLNYKLLTAVHLQHSRVMSCLCAGFLGAELQAALLPRVRGAAVRALQGLCRGDLRAAPAGHLHRNTVDLLQYTTSAC